MSHKNLPSDMVIALLGGFTVYSMLGHLESRSNDPEIYQQFSFKLAFVAYPTGISLLTGFVFYIIVSFAF